MAKAKKKKQQQSCKLMEAIDAIETGASTAAKIYQAVRPAIKAILAIWGRTK